MKTYYKATNEDMTCLDYQYELDKEYWVEGDVIPCENGFHCCERLTDVFWYYSHKGMRLFKVELLGRVIEHGDKHVSEGIRFVEEIKEWHLNLELENGPHWAVRQAVARQGTFLDELKNDPHCLVRLSVAEQGVFLDELKNDPDADVRGAVVRQGAFLDELKNDPDWYVRYMIARQGAFLDELKNDPHVFVRLSVETYIGASK